MSKQLYVSVQYKLVLMHLTVVLTNMAECRYCMLAYALLQQRLDLAFNSIAHRAC
jgi:hypothetical protein